MRVWVAPHRSAGWSQARGKAFEPGFGYTRRTPGCPVSIPSTHQSLNPPNQASLPTRVTGPSCASLLQLQIPDSRSSFRARFPQARAAIDYPTAMASRLTIFLTATVQCIRTLHGCGR
ncbi:hypothetical protein BD414DRAFT_34028 [Trametes punicea]|nr:hypothetical protein BD414DRAFT_34028 [Trametes punicea]